MLRKILIDKRKFLIDVADNMRNDKKNISREYRKRLREIKRLKNRLRGYAEYVLDIIEDLDDKKDPVDQVLEKFKNLSESERHVLPIRILSDGEKVYVEKIISFLESSPPEHINIFRDFLMKELSRRRMLKRDVEKIVSEIDRFLENFDVYIPFHILDYDKKCFEKDKCLFLFKVEIGSKRYLDEYYGSLDDLIEIFREAVRKEAVEIYRLIEKAEKMRRIFMKRLRGLRDFLEEIESHVYENAIFSVLGDRLARPRSWRNLSDNIIQALNIGLEKIGGLESMKWDIKKMRNGAVVYGSNPKLWPDFYEWLVESIKMNNNLVVILRSFRKEIDEITKLPVKEIRGYITFIQEGSLRYIQLSAEELLEAYTRDPETGERIKPEPSVIYCGPGEEKIYSTTLEESEEHQK